MTQTTTSSHDGVPEPAGTAVPSRVPPLPESPGYKIKRRLLGPPIHSNELDHQRLGIPTALAVFSSDCISSSAYATEEILKVLLPVVGLYAFSLVVPITLAMLVVLLFLILSYRETIKEYPTAGGAYMVTRDNFGYKPALVAGVSLLTDYILTVAVSASAGIAALTSLLPALIPYHLPLALVVVAGIAFVNLRGAKESGKVFMVPTYLFIGAMAVLIATGVWQVFGGAGLHHIALHRGAELAPTAHPHGTRGIADTLFYGAGLWYVLQAFASAGTAVTGVEAISNGVSAFHQPEWKNARRTLGIMGATLGVCFLGLSYLATHVHPSPYLSGSPTVISQIGKVVFGSGPVGHGLYFFLQTSTLLILMLAANTSFADFPRLANFAAGDSYMPRQLMKRGQRLVFSNGIFLLAGCAMVLMVVTGANVSRLIPFYAVGVFTSFTMSQAGMTRHHIRKREPGWLKGVFVNGTGAVLSLVVDGIFIATKFAEGAWVILVLVPVIVILLVRMNRQYVEEEAELTEEAAELAGRRILPRLTVLVMVDEVNRATARALQYGRSLHPSEIRAVHFNIDDQAAAALSAQWTTLGLGRIPLEVVECPDRRIENAALQVTADESLSGDREVTVLLPRIEYRRAWHRLLHDRTGNRIAAVVADLPRVNVTFVPYHLSAGGRERSLSIADVIEQHAGSPRREGSGAPAGPTAPATATAVDTEVELDERLARIADRGSTTSLTDIGTAPLRSRVTLTGRVQAIRVQPWSGVATLEITLVDETGSIQLVFLGRRTIAGITTGTRLQVSGVVSEHRSRRSILNPTYRLLG
jgi:amino acid transporter